MAKLSEEILKEALEQYLQTLQMNYYFSGQKQINGATLFWNDKIKDVYWNFTAKMNVKESDVKGLIKKVISFYNKKTAFLNFTSLTLQNQKTFQTFLKTKDSKSNSQTRGCFMKKKQLRPQKQPDLK
ncbi:MAG: hypothetical protein J7K00_01720 [Candidatus Diapherotrites archaeon]|nr:hypothetical protein [Candidatus Diapherotrites archaeon]